MKDKPPATLVLATAFNKDNDSTLRFKVANVHVRARAVNPPARDTVRNVVSFNPLSMYARSERVSSRHRDREVKTEMEFGSQFAVVGSSVVTVNDPRKFAPYTAPPLRAVRAVAI